MEHKVDMSKVAAILRKAGVSKAHSEHAEIGRHYTFTFHRLISKTVADELVKAFKEQDITAYCLVVSPNELDVFELEMPHPAIESLNSVQKLLGSYYKT